MKISALINAAHCLAIASMLLCQQSQAEPNGIHLTSGERRPIVIELFTSQGCSSCPPAERWLGQWIDSDRLWVDIIPLAFHINYWDYIGWQDPFANAETTKRQRRYHRTKGISSVYTPGFVVNGEEWRGWFSGREMATKQLTTDIQLEASVSEQALVATWTQSNPQKLVLNAAILGSGTTTSVSSGENKGKVLKNHFVVLDWQRAKASTGTAQLVLPELDKFKRQKLALVLWLELPYKPGPIQAVGSWLP